MRFPPRNFPDDLHHWQEDGFTLPPACYANWKRMYAVRETSSLLLFLLWFPVVLLSPDSFKPSIPTILAILFAMILSGWSLLFRQWHLRRDAEAYLRADYEAWRRGPDTQTAAPTFLTLTCRVFRHRHPPHDAVSR